MISVWAEMSKAETFLLSSSCCCSRQSIIAGMQILRSRRKSRLSIDQLPPSLTSDHHNFLVIIHLMTDDYNFFVIHLMMIIAWYWPTLTNIWWSSGSLSCIRWSQLGIDQIRLSSIRSLFSWLWKSNLNASKTSQGGWYQLIKHEAKLVNSVKLSAK